ncbi:glycosyl hydrolase family protein [Leptospira ryugenii]|uniref:Glycosyl hydrolase family protein n=1 Tax=Leptospira ryugenii TaxID=1917863 RepID=A0A2P2DYG1_9LEPT|nr:1,4-alpha-glucan branching protein domain-containing protein [Leptospira ryugenii]GBF49640.1 glycosyl hydrolase family protein [Leptospira ryugenii]
MKGYLVFLLHAHLPFVRHENAQIPFIEENWLNEAILETYIPLLRVFRNLKKENVPFKITMSFTPTLSTMLVDPYLQNRFRTYIKNLIALSKSETKRTSGDPHLNYLSKYYKEHFEDTEAIFEELGGDLTKGFLPFFESGSLELITSPATHGFLPLYESEPSIIRSQLRNGRRTFRRIWGRDPKGIWLSECGYAPGLEEALDREGFRYFFVDSHGITHAEPRPKYGVYAPVEVGNGIFAFGRDPESSKQVWSSIDGYPGDFRYREYYRDIGHDLEYEYIQKYLHANGIRINTGIKYFRITGKTPAKDHYHPDWAMEACGQHADDFLRNRIRQAEWLYSQNGQAASILSPYDAELFGHWWYEGPQFIEFLFKKIHFDQCTIRLAHPLEVVRLLPRVQSVHMKMSSWGENGYGDVWLNGTNDWIYEHIFSLSITMQEYAHAYKHEMDEWKLRVLQQMGRELLLLQSSDWAFIMKTQTMVDYAIRRTNVHCNLFLFLKDMLDRGQIDREKLQQIERENPIFPDLLLQDFQ